MPVGFSEFSECILHLVVRYILPFLIGFPVLIAPPERSDVVGSYDAFGRVECREVYRIAIDARRVDVIRALRGVLELLDGHILQHTVGYLVESECIAAHV